MADNNDVLRGLFEGGNFPNAQINVLTGDGVHVSYTRSKEKENNTPDPAAKDAIMEYVKRLKPLVRQSLLDSYETLWLNILEVKEVKMQVYNKGKQQDTVFNRNLVAQITHLLGNRVYVPEAKPVVMAEHLEPGKGKDHPVRQKLGEMPEKNIKNAIEEVIKDDI